MSGYYLSQPSNPIHLNPAHKGKFTEWARTHGFRSIQAAASHVLANREHYSSEVVKMANFAHNARGFHHGNRQHTRPEHTGKRHDRFSHLKAEPVDSEEVPEGEQTVDDNEVDE